MTGLDHLISLTVRCVTCGAREGECLPGCLEKQAASELRRKARWLNRFHAELDALRKLFPHTGEDVATLRAARKEIEKGRAR